MKKSRYSGSQTLNILKQAEAGVPVPALCREHGMSNAPLLQMAGQIRGYGAFSYVSDEFLRASKRQKFYASVEAPQEDFNK